MNEQPSQVEQLDHYVRPMQIIVAALVMGVVFFAVIVVAFLGALNQPPTGMVVSLMGAGFALLMFVLHLVIPNIAVRQRMMTMPPNADVGDWCGAYQTKVILGVAMLEGAAFFNLVAVLIEHNWWSLATAGVLVFWMLIAFPTRSRVEQWIEAQRISNELM